MRLSVAFVLTAITALTGCDDRPNHWEAWISPGGDDEAEAFVIDGFVNFDTCQRAAIQQLERLEATRVGSYECGYKCGPLEEFGGMKVCKETRR